MLNDEVCNARHLQRHDPSATDFKALCVVWRFSLAKNLDMMSSKYALRLVTSSLLFGVKAARNRPELREIGWQRTVPFVINLKGTSIWPPVRVIFVVTSSSKCCSENE
jgi:hypothetical protein